MTMKGSLSALSIAALSFGQIASSAQTPPPVPRRAQVITAPIKQAEEPIKGEKIAPSEVVIEGLEEALERERLVPKDAPNKKRRNGRPGAWQIASRRSTYHPHSGIHNAYNKWGDVRLGIGFKRPVDLHGLWIAGQAGEGVWAKRVRAVGYRDGQRVSETKWFREISDSPRWFSMELEKIDRVVLEADPVVGKAAWYAIDDLTFTRRDAQATEENRTVVEVTETVTVSDVVQALNDLGASTRDLIHILQALHRAGALRAELVVM